jgi:hypothetical protein
MDIVNSMDDEDGANVLEKLDQYIAMGVPAAKAQRMAVADALEELAAEAKEFMRLVTEQNPEPEVAPEPEAAAAPVVEAEPAPQLVEPVVDKKALIEAGKAARAERLKRIKPKREKAGEDAALMSARDQTETPEFKKWFGSSAVVGADGKPLVMYHSTNAMSYEDKAGFSVFNTKSSELGSHFGTIAQANSFGAGERRRVMPVYLSITKPLRLQDQGAFDADRITGQLENLGIITSNEADAIRKLPGDAAAEVMQASIEKAGYDGVVYLNRREGADVFGADGVSGAELDEMSDEDVIDAFPEVQDSWIAFRPTQIKSAIGNSGAFDANDPDIRKSARDTVSTMWMRYADGPDAFKFGNSPAMRSKSIDDILKEFSTPTLRLTKDDMTMEGKGVQIIVNGDPDMGRMAIKQAYGGRYIIDATEASPYDAPAAENQGQRMYQALFAYAHNNGLVVDSDFSISPVNEVRRNSAMLSSALRFGTTKHFGRLADEQGVEGWVDGAHEDNIAALAVAEMQKVEQRVKRFTNFEISPESGRVYYRNSAVLDASSQAYGNSPVPLDGKPAGSEQGAIGPGDSGSFGNRLGDGENDARRPDGSAQDNGVQAAGGSVLLGNGAKIQGSAVTDSQLRDHLASTGGGFSSHGVGVQTLKRALYTQSAAESGLIESGVSRLLNSKRDFIGRTNRNYTPEQLKAFANVGFDVETPTLKERAQALWKDAGKKMAQGIVDQFAPIKELSPMAYGLLRLAKGASGAFETLLQGGRLKLTDGVYDFDDTKKGGVLDRLLKPMQGEHHDFLRWVAANRAERLMGEDREHLFTQDDIDAIKTLADGDTKFDYKLQHGPNAGQTTRNRAQVWADSLVTFNEFHENVMDMAEQSGLVDAEARKLWDHEFYVPFYRVSEENGVSGANIKGGAVRQQAFKKLKGGTDVLNADLLDNTLMNWAHLLDAAAKNRGAKAALEAAEKVGVAISATEETARQMGKATGNRNGVVWFMDGGQQRYYLVDDQYVLQAITSLEFSGMKGPMMNAMSAMKNILTMGVTASPFFKIRNLIRDSVQVIGTSAISANPAKNLADGWKLTDPKHDVYFRLLAGGGTIHFGTMYEGSEAKRVQALVESGVDRSTILGDEKQVQAFYRKFIEPGITAYNELGNRGESVNRAALYAQLIKQGVSHADASLQARDLMDFSMQGSFATVRFLTQIVPFLNARLQGMYKLGRATKEDPKRMAYVTGAVVMASLGLLAAYGDDDDWRKRENWDRDNYWWFKFGGQAFRVPKPFEIGAIGTLAERSAELLFDDEMSGTQFRARIMDLLSSNLAMNPIPQLVKPMMDVYANKDAFSGRPIETMSMERLAPEYRFTANTSVTARALSTTLNEAASLIGKEALSPVQIDSLIKGYFGWLGVVSVGMADMVTRPALGEPKKPDADLWKTATGGMVASLEGAPSKYVSKVYEQAKEIEQAYGTWRALQKQGKTDEAQEYRAANEDKIQKYRNVEAVKGALSKINQRIREIERSDMDPADKRAEIIRLNARKDQFSRKLAA